VLFQVALGAFHLDVLVSGELRADPIKRSGTGFKVLVAPGLEISLQDPAD